MRNRSRFADIILGGNQHSRWLYCRPCRASGAVQTLDMMSCVTCSLTHIGHPEVDTRKTCAWTKWLQMIARYRFRMTETEKGDLQRQIQRRQDRRRLRRLALQQVHEETSTTVQATEQTGGLRQVDEWEEVIRRERLSLLAHHATMEGSTGSGATSSGSTQQLPEARIVHVEHVSFASPYIVTTRRTDGTVLQRDIRTGRTRMLVSGEFVPATGEDHDSEEPGQDSTISAINVGTVREITLKIIIACWTQEQM